MIGFVAGFGRCGASLTMRMLEAGGLPVTGTGAAMEDARFTPRRTDCAWLVGQSGRIVKWVCPLTTYAPEEARGRVLWLDRNPMEQARSQVKLQAAMGGRWRDREARVLEVADFIAANTARALSWAADHGKVERLSFESLLADPQDGAKRLASYFRPFGVLDVIRAAAVVRPRGPACPREIEFDLAAEPRLFLPQGTRRHA